MPSHCLRPAAARWLWLAVALPLVAATGCTRENPDRDPRLDPDVRCAERRCPGPDDDPVARDGGPGDDRRPAGPEDAGRRPTPVGTPDLGAGEDGSHPLPPLPDGGLPLDGPGSADAGPDVPPRPDVPPPPLCEPGTPVCVDASRAALCDAQGTGYAQVRTCEPGTECRAGACRDPQVLICKPGDPVCVDEGREATCDAEGTGYTAVRSCAEGEICRDGRCTRPDAQSCTPGDSYCDSVGTVVYCPDDGRGYVSYTCSSGYACSVRGDHAGCFRSGSCTPAGDWHCDGDVLARCDGTFREELTNCLNQFGLCLDDPVTGGACCEALLLGQRICCSEATGCTTTSTTGG